MALMTHEGSGLGNSERDLRKICKGAVFGSGIAVHGADAASAESAVADWACRNCRQHYKMKGVTEIWQRNWSYIIHGQMEIQKE